MASDSAAAPGLDPAYITAWFNHWTALGAGPTLRACLQQEIRTDDGCHITAEDVLNAALVPPGFIVYRPARGDVFILSSGMSEVTEAPARPFADQLKWWNSALVGDRFGLSALIEQRVEFPPDLEVLETDQFPLILSASSGPAGLLGLLGLVNSLVARDGIRLVAHYDDHGTLTEFTFDPPPPA
jgi:hypothetical protein